ncbi:hypothetical protein BDP67DRAFT_502858 [Colletotrichum lupini]|nr:hypothetical protein BDP67DRAFT_502858 [Colletotrichum lupini]
MLSSLFLFAHACIIIPIMVSVGNPFRTAITYSSTITSSLARGHWRGGARGGDGRYLSDLNGSSSCWAGMACRWTGTPYAPCNG